MFSGAIVAIVTPFKGGKIDEKAFQDLIKFQMDEGISGIVPCGTTGESATLTHKEHERVIAITVETVGGKIPVIAGTGSNSTDEAISLTRHAKSFGVDAVLLITPYYNKPTQKGLYYHYKAIAAACDIPQILYNVPGRTGLDMSAQTVVELSKIDNIVGIKEASGNLMKCAQIIKGASDDFVLLSGEDGVTLPILSLGGKGVISVTANVLPKMMSAMIRKWLEGDIEASRKLHYELLDMHNAMFIETNPIPAKTALAMMGKIKEEFKLPLCKMSNSNRDKLAGVLRSYKCI
ncbi:MAG: 4-hydroxy-tetrahydrodipicolinate synthase [Thermodesulfobacteriota bacterium]|nr:4-hydroxy-tetrahydrodipicolinate synthase [Thermodesulfobacteriota bacterium]